MTAMTIALHGDTQVIVTRRFAAAPERVFAAHTDPALMARWMTGPDGWVMTQCQIDARPGGTMRCSSTLSLPCSLMLLPLLLPAAPADRLVVA